MRRTTWLRLRVLRLTKECEYPYKDKKNEGRRNWDGETRDGGCSGAPGGTRRRFRWSINLLASKILSYAVTCTPERARAPQLSARPSELLGKSIEAGKLSRLIHVCLSGVWSCAFQPRSSFHHRPIELDSSASRIGVRALGRTPEVCRQPLKSDYRTTAIPSMSFRTCIRRTAVPLSWASRTNTITMPLRAKITNPVILGARRQVCSPQLPRPPVRRVISTHAEQRPPRPTTSTTNSNAVCHIARRPCPAAPAGGRP